MSLGRRSAGEEGYVLHARPWRDTSLLLDVWLEQGVRRGVVARGGRSNQRLRGVLQPFGALWLDLAGRGELAQVRAAEPLAGRHMLSGRRLVCGYYLNELILRLVQRDDPHPELYTAYVQALQRLGAGEAEAGVLRMFEKILLESLGWAPDWRLDIHGQPLQAQALYYVHPDCGIVPAAQGKDRAIRGISFLHLAKACFDNPGTAREIRLILHTLLAPHLGPQPLRSRELLNLGAARAATT